MDKELFWQIIEQARVLKGNSIDEGIRSVQDTLKSYSAEDIIKFQVIYDTYKEAADRELIMGLACLLMGCSSSDECVDVFDYFLDVLVLYGKDRYMQTLRKPDSFVETLSTKEQEEYDVEALNCLTYMPFVVWYPDKDYKEFYLASALEEEEVDRIMDEIVYSSFIDDEWDELGDLEGVLPKLFAICCSEE